MYHIIYVSSANKPFTPAELDELLTQSRAKNSAMDITGLLVYRGGNFIQMIEGEEGRIRQLYKTICADKRHNGSIILSEGPIQEKQFSGWAMDYRVVDQKPLFTDAELANDKDGIKAMISDFIANMR